jgi:hypothetical protein
VMPGHRNQLPNPGWLVKMNWSVAKLYHSESD